MSLAPSPTAANTDIVMEFQPDISGQSRKSYRRKYRKIMVKFEHRVQESNGLFRDEQRILDISQRLAEEIDQLLQVLLDFNNRPYVPRSLRYNLEPPKSTKRTIPSKIRGDEQALHESLRVSRNQVQKGEKSVHDHERLQDTIVNKPEFAPLRSYASIVQEVAATVTSSSSNAAVTAPSVGSLTIKQEEQYLQSLDNFLDNKTNDARAHAMKSLGSRTTERTADREREIQLKNPVSAYNWLRKHQPQVFLQDHEATGDRGKTPGPRSSKRNAKESKHDQDYYDEDGFAADQTGVSRGKRKRDDDTAFRPKGGRSGQAGKRRKEDGGGKRSKRSSVDAHNS